MSSSSDTLVDSVSYRCSGSRLVKVYRLRNLAHLRNDAGPFIHPFPGSPVALITPLRYMRAQRGLMPYLSNYSSALRCIGQALQNQDIEVFDIKSYANSFHIQGGDPNPPYTDLIELDFSSEDITILDREGQARRGQSTDDVRFDSVAEILRAVGDYIDSKRVYLRRINNSSSMADQPVVEIEYETRDGDSRSENLAVSFIREGAVQMYKRRTRLSNPINMLTRGGRGETDLHNRKKA